MITELKKTPSTRGSVSDTKFWFSLPDEVVNLIGGRTIIQRHPITKAFVLSKPGLDSRLPSTVISFFQKR